MTSLMTKTLTAAALAALMIGGMMTAQAQFTNDQPYNVPFLEEQAIFFATDEDEPLDGLTKGLWIYDGDYMNTGHEWVGLAGGSLIIRGLYHNFWDIYHRGGTIDAYSSSIKIDRLWVTTDTFNAHRYSSHAAVIGAFIFQVGETNVHGEPFGVKTADKKLFIGVDKGWHGISYGGVECNNWGVNNTALEIRNYAGGVIDDVKVNADTLTNYSGATIHKATLTSSGRLNNSGYIDELHMDVRNGCSGWVDNTGGHIGTLYYYLGTDPSVLPKTGTIDKIIYVNAYLDAMFVGMDGAGFDESYFDENTMDEDVIDNVDFDNAGWQDAAPLGEEGMVW